MPHLLQGTHCDPLRTQTSRSPIRVQGNGKAKIKLIPWMKGNLNLVYPGSACVFRGCTQRNWAFRSTNALSAAAYMRSSGWTAPGFPTLPSVIDLP